MVDRGELLSDKISRACLGQSFIGESAVVFVWAAIPYRTEWRYSVIAYKDILIEAGHICQNLYLACEAIGAGICAIAAYDQKAMDSLIGVDGIDEFTVYLAPVGKIEPIRARAAAALSRACSMFFAVRSATLIPTTNAKITPTRMRA